MSWLWSRRLAQVGGTVLVIALALLGLRLVFAGPKQKTATAFFPVAVHVYAGSDVDVLGVQVGTVKSVTPEGTDVKVVLSYDASRKIPANASAVVVEPTLVADRVVQLAPVYTGGAVMADNAVIPIQRTEVPVELAQLDASLVKLTDALGPQGANKNGALTRAIETGDANLHGEGAQANTTIHKVSDLMSTLSGNRQALVSTVNNLQAFTSTLATHDAQTREFTSELARVSGELDSERNDFSAALHNLGIALGQVTGFIKDNRDQLASDVQGMSTVTNILSHERLLLAHLVDMGAVGVSNYPHMYTPSQRTYNARFDGDAITDNPTLFVCQLLGAAGGSPSQCLKLLNPLKKITIPTSASK